VLFRKRHELHCGDYRTPHDDGAAAGSGNTSRLRVSHIIDGFQFATRTGPISALLLLLGLVSVTGMPYAVLMPVFADQIFHSGARGLGILMGFSGVGALLGALTLASREGVRGLAGGSRSRAAFSA